MNAKRTLIVVVLVALAAIAGPATGGVVAQSDEPGEPVVFYGSASTASGDVPEGTTIVLAVDGDKEDSITVGENGVYATDEPTADKLETHTNAGSTITFHVGSVDGPAADEELEMSELGSGVFEQDLTGFEDSNIAESISLTVDGESGSVSITEGASADATVEATFADGSTSEVTADAMLTSDDTSVASIDGGTVSAESLGSATISAEYQGLTDDIDVEVVEEAQDDEDTSAGTGGGGGGGQPADDDDDDAVDEPASKTIALAGTNPEVRIDGGESISMIGFGSQVELDDTVTVTELTESPAPAPPGATFVIAADITFSSTNGEDVDTVQMGVQQSTLDKLGVSSNQLALYHLNEDTGEWEALETKVTYEDKFEVVLEAPSAGFSTYAVFAQEDVTTTTTTQEPTTEEPTTEEPTTTEKPPTTTETPDEGGPGALLIGGIFVVVLALLAALYLAFGRE